MGFIGVRVSQEMEESLRRLAKKRRMGKATVIKKILKANLPHVDPVIKRRRKRPKGFFESIFGASSF